MQTNFFRFSLLFLIPLVWTACRTDSSSRKDTGQTLGRSANEVIVRLEAEPDVLHPMLTVSGYALEVYPNIFDVLMDFHPESLDYVPVLAQDMPQEEVIQEGVYKGGMRYTFEIRPEAEWPDGKPVTAKDYSFFVKASFLPNIEGNVYRGALSVIREVQLYPDNPRKFTVTLFPKSLQTLEYASNWPIIPRHIFDPEGALDAYTVEDLNNPEKAQAAVEEDKALQAFAKNFVETKYARDPAFVVGSGPYELESWASGQQIVLKKKDSWWGDALAEEHDILAAYPERLIFEPINDRNTAIARLKNQEIDVLGMLPNKEMIDARDNELVQAHYEFLKAETTTRAWMYLNTRNPKLEDVQVRRALAHLVNVDQLLDDLAFGMGTRLVTPVMPNKPYFNEELRPVPYSLDQANQLLDAAGWTDSNNNGIRDKKIDGQLTELSLEYMCVATSAISKVAGLLLQETAKRAGIEVKVEYQEFNVMKEKLIRLDYEICGGGARSIPGWYDPYLRFHSDNIPPNGGNYSAFGTPQTDALIETIRYGSAEDRTQAYRDFQKIVYDQQPLIFLYNPLVGIFVHNRFEASASPKRPGYHARYFKVKGEG